MEILGLSGWDFVTERGAGDVAVDVVVRRRAGGARLLLSSDEGVVWIVASLSVNSEEGDSVVTELTRERGAMPRDGVVRAEGNGTAAEGVRALLAGF